MKSRMPIVYIAGPYRGAHECVVYRNIQRAREAAELVWRSGGVAICPHLNTAFMGGVVPDETFLEGDLLLVERSHALYAIFGSTNSEGAMGEIKHAKQRGLPVFIDELSLRKWITEFRLSALTRSA